MTPRSVPLMKTLSLRTKLMIIYVKEDIVFTVCFIGMMIVDMGFILSAIYFSAWVSTQYFDNSEEGIIKSKEMVEEISSLTIFMGVLFGLLAGFLSDKVRMGPLLIFSFGVRALGLLMMPFVSKERFFLFICTLCLNVGNALETVAVSLL